MEFYRTELKKSICGRWVVDNAVRLLGMMTYFRPVNSVVVVLQLTTLQNIFNLNTLRKYFLFFRLYEDGTLTPPPRGEKMLTKLSIDTASSTGSARGAFLSSSQPQTPTNASDSPFASRSNELKV